MMDPPKLALAERPPERRWSSSPDLAHAEADLERARQDVAHSLLALRGHVARQMAWRGWVRRRPLAFVMGGFAVGFLFGYRSATRRRQ